MNETAERSELLQLIRELAVVRGDVVLSSGAHAKYYVDLRRITLHSRASALVGAVLLGLLDDAGIAYEAAGGLTMGADPVGNAMMHVAREQGRVVDTFVVRKAAKKHGLRRQVEGPSVAGRPVVVVEDTSTTGQSPLQAVEGVRAAGGIVQAVAVIVDRATGARELIEREAGVPYLAAYTKDDVGLDAES